MRASLPAKLCFLASLAFTLSFALAAHGQTYTDLYNLGETNTDPLNPAWMGTFAQGRDGNLYSTTQAGGDNKVDGTIFQLTPSGGMTELLSFGNIGHDGLKPNSGLTLGTDGNLYGTTPAGGANGYGTIFRIAPGGTYTVVHSFVGTTEGTSANTPPIQGFDDNFYGTTGDGVNMYGTFYKMTPAGVVTVLYKFPATNRYPRGIVLGNDGNFYGTTVGTSTGLGTVFKMTPQGKITILHTFTGSDGANPIGQLILANDGNFYSTTEKGGSGLYGVVYKITPSGVFTVLHNFANDGQGSQPLAGLVPGTDGKFYGTVSTNPGVSAGLLYQITSTGVYTILHQYTRANNDGGSPQTAMIQHTGGILFGDTENGGTGTFCACGVLYSLDMDLNPFVTFLPPHSQGKVGKMIGLLGQGFTGATNVTFNGTAASFHVASDTYMTTTVPSGAGTGSIRVTGGGGTLTSNRIFRVTPQLLSFDPPSGPVGTQVTITGVSLTQTLGVGFGDRIPAQFTVNSDTQVTAIVPSGAKTGPVGIETKGGIAISSGMFTVTQ